MFKSIIDAGTTWPVILGVIASVNSVIAFFYYASILREMWMRPVPLDDRTPVKIPAALTTALAICTVGIVAIGVYPGMLTKLVDVSSTFGALIK